MKYKIWYANLVEISASKKIALLEHFNNEEEIYNRILKGDLKDLCLSDKDEKYLSCKVKDHSLEYAYEDYFESGVSVVTYNQQEYPDKLRYIHNPPYALFYYGKLPDMNCKNIAIVGARGRSAYGCEVTRKLSEILAQKNVGIISGMARGIDGDAHQGALEAGGNTYAVLGCGADICYPKENRFIYEKLKQQGGIISEYPPHTKPIAMQFPMRNRIISGLSDAIVVIEARKKSGSLITADFAIEQGKDVYALPGRITDELSGGTNRLLSQGAIPIISIEEFIQDLNLIPQNINIQLDFRKNLLEKEESLVYSLLDFRPISVGTLIENVSFSLLELLEILEHLSDKGYIREITPNFYVKTI